jgi:hypothetical protein
MQARRFFIAAIVAAAATGCGTGSPTLANLSDPPVIPDAPPTDTAGFVPLAPPTLP